VFPIQRMGQSKRGFSTGVRIVKSVEELSKGGIIEKSPCTKSSTWKNPGKLKNMKKGGPAIVAGKRYSGFRREEKKNQASGRNRELSQKE